MRIIDAIVRVVVIGWAFIWVFMDEILLILQKHAGPDWKFRLAVMLSIWVTFGYATTKKDKEDFK